MNSLLLLMKSTTIKECNVKLVYIQFIKKNTRQGMHNMCQGVTVTAVITAVTTVIIPIAHQITITRVLITRTCPLAPYVFLMNLIV